MDTTIRQRRLIVLVDAKTPAEANNLRGHLFEQFIAQLLGVLGYNTPTRESVNVSSDGIELDVRTRHALTRQVAIAECKAYSANVSAKELLAFYGKLGSERIGDSSLFGVFVAIPGLTPPGREQRDKLVGADKSFRVLTLDEICEQLLQRDQIRPLSTLARVYGIAGDLTDEALLVTETGLFTAAREADPETKLARRVVVFPANGEGGAPQHVADALALNSYGTGIPCVAVRNHTSREASPVATLSEPTIAEVTGSTADFEYHLPASPQFFVGRGSHVADLTRIVSEVTGQNTKARVLVFNAQSGWGKSSLALTLRQLVLDAGGAGVCIDCRTAVQPVFVAAAVRRALNTAQRAGILSLPEDASFASTATCAETLRRATFSTPPKPLLIFFDQFENVFRSAVLTREFRDLAYAIADLSAPVVLGFAWKTDLLAFTENHPFQYRDDIRSRSLVFPLEPFGPIEIGNLLTRLQSACGQRIHRDLRDRIREYSQGLPWLFKKLASHIQKELLRGVTQDQLISEVLNVQSLFESDLRGLSIAERQTLKAIARNAPILASDAVELSGGAAIVESLLNQRLLVQVGERLDIYWDIFRDYIVNGSVPLQDSYILRLTPRGVSKFLCALRAAGESLSLDDAAAALNTSKTAVLNVARDLRVLGVLAVQDGPFRFIEGIASAADPNEALRGKVAVSLKRHRIMSLLYEMSATGGPVEMGAFISELPKQYPAVAAQPSTWGNYARAFAYWFQYAGLATLNTDQITPGIDQQLATDLFSGKRGPPRAKTAVVFPRGPAGPVLALVHGLGLMQRTRRSGSKPEADAIALGLLDYNDDEVWLSALGTQVSKCGGDEEQRALAPVLAKQPAYVIAADMVGRDPATRPVAIGRAIAERYGLTWKDGTAEGAGKFLRSWCRACGVATQPRER